MASNCRHTFVATSSGPRLDSNRRQCTAIEYYHFEPHQNQEPKVMYFYKDKDNMDEVEPETPAIGAIVASTVGAKNWPRQRGMLDSCKEVDYEKKRNIVLPSNLLRTGTDQVGIEVRWKSLLDMERSLLRERCKKKFQLLSAVKSFSYLILDVWLDFLRNSQVQHDDKRILLAMTSIKPWKILASMSKTTLMLYEDDLTQLHPVGGFLDYCKKIINYCVPWLTLSFLFHTPE